MTNGKADRDEGSVTLLSLGFAIVAILLILVGAAVTGVYLDRTRLVHVADELALDAADAMDVGTYYAGGAPRPTEDAGIAVSEASVRAVVASRLPAAESRRGLEGVQIVEVSCVDGHTVTVVVAMVSHPQFGLDSWLPWGGVTIVATSSARVH